MSDLWAASRQRARAAVEPLAVRMRPRRLEELAGQEHLLGEGKLLRRMLEADVITSLILHGPPGTGKTTLAELVASYTNRYFERENASSVGVKRIREIIDEADHRLQSSGRRSILFLDEIHRFTKSQQDVLLADVERGIITLIGATTENPLFACNSALVSRSTLFRLEPLSSDAVAEVLRRAVDDAERGFGGLDIELRDEAIRVWTSKSDGDARRALTALEVAVLSGLEERDGRLSGDRSGGVRPGSEEGAERDQESSDEAMPTLVIDQALAEASIQQKAAVYSASGDEHFDSISAMIKSIRGCDPDAALYWMARMLDAGEDPRYIARRLAVLASEDIGNADPRAVMVASSCWELVERIGMPECRITLSQCATYLALAPKSNAAYVAIDAALEDVRDARTIAVPMYLRDANSSPVGEGQFVKDAAARAGESYEYSHNAEQGVTGQDYLGVEKSYYVPTDSGFEARLRDRLREIKALRSRLRKRVSGE